MGYVVATVVVFLLYAAAAYANPTRTEGVWSGNPLLITSGVHGRASLSKLQIFFFSLIVIWLLTYFLVESSKLGDLSGTVMMLLGVSAAGTVGAKVTAVVRKRLSGENWSWLVNKGWIDKSIEPEPKPPEFKELMTSEGEFDVAKFQALAVSLLVGAAMIYSGLESNTLVDFEIPANVVGLLGLSQAIYITGKAVGPPAVADLDKKVTALRKLEGDFITEVSRAWRAKAPTTADMAAAKRAAPDAYNLYIAGARQAAVMVQERTGASKPLAKLDPELPSVA